MAGARVTRKLGGQGPYSRVACMGFALLIAVTAAAAPQDAQPPDVAVPDLQPEAEVVVSGEQPGPGLWKVSKGNHVMWILGTVSPLPKRMKWRSGHVEEVIAGSQQVLAEESVKANIGFFRGLRLLPAVLRARYNPDGAVLEDLVDAETYARWLPLRAKYFDDDKDVEKIRPMFIAFQLYAKAIDDVDLTRKNITSKVIKRAAKKNRVKVKSPRIRLEVDDPRQAIKDFTETPRDADVACFVETIASLESDVDAMKARANAWAVGDVEALRKLPVPVQEATCREAVTSAPGLQDEIEDAKERVISGWVDDAVEALGANAVTFAVLPMFEVLDSENGRLAALRRQGYEVTSPLE